jgi:hypothetical protein
MNIQNWLFSPKKWLYWLLGMTLSVTLTIFSINFLVDPFGEREWVAPKRYKPIVHERSEKYNYIFNQNNIQNYDCLILGNSRVMSIVPSENKPIQECYNFGVHVANNPEKLFILEEWLKRAPLKKVYLGNDLYTMHQRLNPLEFKSERFTKGSENNYLAFSTLKISIKVLNNLFYDHPQVYFNNDGSIVYSQYENEIKEGKFDHSDNHFVEMARASVHHDFVQTPFAYEPKALDSLKKIKKLCDQHKIELYTFITPTFHEAKFQMEQNSELNQSIQRFQNDLVHIFGKVYNFDIDTSLNRDPRNFYDIAHYRPIIGHFMVERIEQNGSYGEELD